MITRSGYILTDDKFNEQTKRDLTVRPIVQGDYARPKSFKVYKQSRGCICVPKYYGISCIGKPSRDTRISPTEISLTFSAKLKPHQIEAHKKGVEALDSIGGGVLNLPCGWGKTMTSISIACHFKVRTMICVHKEFLASQWREVLQRVCPGCTIGLVQGDSLDIEKDFVICMLQTLSQREYQFGTFDSIGLLIVDECHHICARVFSQCMFKLCPKYTLGLSATPERKDGLTKVLHWFMGPIFHSVTRNANSIEVIPVHFTGPFPDVKTTKFGKISLPSMITDLCLIPERNEEIYKILDELVNTTRHILVLTDRREHASTIVEHYKDSAGLYIGGMKQEDLDISAQKKIVVATFSLAQEGLDIPTLDTALFVTPKTDVIQASGRILRAQTENRPTIYDFVDHWSVFYAMYKKRCSVYTVGSPETKEKIKWIE